MTELRNCTTNFFPEVCGVNIVVDPQADLGQSDDRILVLGQIGAAGTAVAGSLHQVTDGSRVGLFGANSMLNRMIDDVEGIAPTAEIWAYAVADNGTQGTSDVTFTGVAGAMAAGIVYLWVNGFRYQASFDPASDTDDTLAAKFQADVDSNPALTATAAANVLTITTDASGEVAGQLDVRTSYDGQPSIVSSGEVTLAVATVPGTGFPDLSGLPGLAEGFEFVVNPFIDDVSIGNVSDYLCSQWSGGANSRAYGVFYGSHAQAITFGQSANDALLAYLAVNGGLTPSYLESAAYTALAFNQLNSQSDDIAASMQGQVLPAMLPPASVDQFSSAEKAALVEAGMGYVDITRVGDVTLGRAVTTYTTRDNGSLDESLRDVNKPAIIATISKLMREEITSRFSGFAFRSDGVVGGNADNVATIPQIRNFIVSLGQQLSDRNLIQDLDGFINSILIVQGEGGCIEIRLDPELVDPFCCLNLTLRTI